MAINVAENLTVMENAIEDRLLEYFSTRNVDLTDIFTAYKIKQVTFNAAWKYCYNCLFKPGRSQPDNRHSIINYNNDEQLSNICDAYLDLCFQYHIEPTRYGFSRLSGIDYDTLDRWKNHELQGEASKTRYDVIKRILEASKNYTRAELENTPVGQITKANNDEEKGLLYSRTQAQSMLSAAAAMETPEQIAARYSFAELPEKPEFDE